MRKGQNPSKLNNLIKINSLQRVILSVYIPDLMTEYFQHSLEIFKLCLESLLFTINSQTRISIILNGCCKEVEEFVFSYKELNHEIDQVFVTKENIGKINAIYSIVKSNLEPLITVSDSDVLFLPGWQAETINIFNDFPSAGMVSPVPSSKGYLNSTRSSVYFGIFKAKIRFRDVLNPDAMDKFQKSINSKIYEDVHLNKYLVISKSGKEAVLGCGHFVATFRKEVFENSPNRVCEYRVHGDSEKDYLDEPNDFGGFLRLATLDNFAYHMGNVPENWMVDKLIGMKTLKSKSLINFSIPKPEPLNKFEIFIGSILWVNLFYRFRRIFFWFLGMNFKY